MIKKLLACLAFALLLCIKSSLAQVSKINIAEKIVSCLQNSWFDSIPPYFNDDLQDRFPAMMIESKWSAVQNSVGPFIKQIHTAKVQSDTLEAVLVTCKFEKTNLDVKLIFDKSDKISGFWIRQASFDPNYKVPTYALTDSITESAMTIPSSKPALPATFTYRKKAKNFPVIIFVHGSGPNDRDETIGGSKLFKDLALGLATNGIATLRYDKRTQAFPEYFTKIPHPTVYDETINDVNDAIKMVLNLEGVDTTQIYVLGHSLGAELAPRIALANPKLAGIIMMAAPARPMEVLIAEQLNYICCLKGNVKPDAATASLIKKAEFVQKKKYSLASPDSLFPFSIPASYWLDLQKYDQVATAKKLSTRVLLMQGERDYQVTLTDLNIWKKELAGKKNCEIKSYPKLNHAFMEGEGKCKPEEYSVSATAPEYVVKDITSWIEKK